MIKVGSCTVLYNPDENVVSNLNSYIKNVDTFVIVDNSDIKNNISIEIKNCFKENYIDMYGNKGIAAALNRGIDELKKRDVDYALTMDQDSEFPIKFYKNILGLIEKYKNEYSVIGLNFNNQIMEKTDSIVEVPCWLTSGNFVNISDFTKIGKFDEQLFIDYVDIEMGYKLYKNGLKICYLNDYSLNHSIGNPIAINIFGKKFYSMNHNKIRYYYRYRNSYYLFKKNKNFFKKYFYKEMFINIPKMLIFEKDRKGKMIMIKKGLHDASIANLGKYNE